MINVVNFSGGRTSAYMVSLFEQKRKSEGIEVVYLYCDTGAEHPKTYEFIRNVVDHFKIDLVCIRAKVSKTKGVGTTYEVVSLGDCKQDLKPFLDVCEVYSTPSYTFGHCTREMKSNPAKKYCQDKYGKEYLNWLGIRIDEPRRLNIVDNQVDLFATKKRIDRSRVNVRYLAGISDFTKEDVLGFWRNMPFDLEIEEHLGNCVFCVKKGVNKVALAARDEPEMASAFIDMIASDKVASRPGSPLGKEVMYRGRSTLCGIIEQYADSSRDEIARTIRGMKQNNAGACSESCEAMFDLFD